MANKSRSPNTAAQLPSIPLSHLYRPTPHSTPTPKTSSLKLRKAARTHGVSPVFRFPECGGTASHPLSQSPHRRDFRCSQSHQRADRRNQRVPSPGLTALGKRGTPSRTSHRDQAPGEPQGLRVCELPLSPPGATQRTPTNFPEASTPSRGSRPQPRLLLGSWRSPESQVRAHLHTLSSHCGPQPWGSVCPRFRSPRRLLRTTCARLHRLGGPRVACVYRFISLRVCTTQHTSDALKVHPVSHPSAYLAYSASRSRPGCAFWFTHFAILSVAKGKEIL